MHSALKAAASDLTRVRHLEIDAQQGLEFLCHHTALQNLTVRLIGPSQNDNSGSLPPLADLRLLRLCFDGMFSSRDTSAGRHHLGLADLSSLEGLMKLELRGTVGSSLWSGSIVRSS